MDKGDELKGDERQQGNTQYGVGGNNPQVQGNITGVYINAESQVFADVNINLGTQEYLEGMDTRCSNVLSMLGKRKRDFNNAPLERVEPQIVEFNSSTDSEPRLLKILELIEDVGIRKIGIWGMGGIGKTRTLKLFNNRLEKSRLFDIVILVTVSGEGSQRKVQDDIARRLDITERDLSDGRLRASISKNLSGKKFLLILDDIWESIDLSEVGIPIPNQDNGCKVLLATREFGVCQEMETDVDIQMEKLSEEKAWSLFIEKAGDVAMSPCIEPIARKIVKKCGGLPLAIIVIGSSLRNISVVDMWRSTRTELQLSCTSQIKGMERKVFSCLRISYNRLLNDSERNMFLYCSLYSEDFEISITKLADYCWLEGYIQGVYSIEKARDVGHHMAMNLVAASLLERCDNEEHVKMHDIIRNFALKEASVFLVRTGKHVKHPPEEEEWLKSQKISLMNSSLVSLLELQRPNCSTLSTLLLQYNDQLTVIPDPFFECMRSLCILDLSRTGIKSLPTSLCNLVNLRGLFLKRCHKLRMIPDPFFERMCSLCILDLTWSGIKSFPTSLCNLVNLRGLFLKYCRDLTMIPHPFFERMRSLCILDLSGAGIKSLPTSLCNLVNLRGLFLNGCYNLKELPSQVGALGQLEVLDLGGFTAIKYLPREVGKLTRLKRLIVGFKKRNLWQNNEDACSEDDDDEDACSEDVCSEDDDDEDACSEAACCEDDDDEDACSKDDDDEHASSCIYSKDYDDEDTSSEDDDEEWNMQLRVPTGIIPNLRDLEELSLFISNGGYDCAEKEQWDDESMEVVVKELCELEHLTYLDACFPKEECLEHFLANSKSVKATSSSSSSFFRRFQFRVVTETWETISRLNKKWERSLVYKGGLGMSHAAVMKTLAHSSFFHLQEHRTARKLSELGLENMNELKECWIHRCDKMETLFDGHEQQESCALLPILEELDIWQLPELRSFYDGPLLPGSFSKLRRLYLICCENLKKVFQSGIIRQLCSLEYLEASDCLKMEEIIEIEEEMYNNDRLILPNFKTICLFYLPELVSICRGFCNFEWPSLETIYIDECPKLKSLSFLSNGTNIVAPALREIEGSSEWWEALEWEDNDIKQRLQPFHTLSVKLWE